MDAWGHLVELGDPEQRGYRVGAPNYREGVPVADITAYAVTVLQVHRVASP